MEQIAANYDGCECVVVYYLQFYRLKSINYFRFFLQVKNIDCNRSRQKTHSEIAFHLDNRDLTQKGSCYD